MGDRTTATGQRMAPLTPAMAEFLGELQRMRANDWRRGARLSWYRYSALPWSLKDAASQCRSAGLVDAVDGGFLMFGGGWFLTDAGRAVIASPIVAGASDA